MRKVFLLSFLLWLGCNNKLNETKAILILAPPDTAKDGRKPMPFPPDPRSGTTCFNFIFDDNETLYVYQHFYDKDSVTIPGTVSDVEIPSFIGLTPDRIIALSDVAIKPFFVNNVLHVDPAYKSVSIVGVTDTIKSEALTTLLQELTTYSTKVSYYVRPATLEERVVLDYKKKQKFYYSDKINWDSLQLQFNRRK